MGWRFVNPRFKERYGVDTMPQTGEYVASQCHISRADQDAFALRSQQRAAAAEADGFLREEITPVPVAGAKRGTSIEVVRDEHPRGDTTLEALSTLRPLFGPEGTVTAGNASGINDGAAALLVASAAAARRHGLIKRARILGMAAGGVEPRVMGLGPIPAIDKLLTRLNLGIGDFDAIEINEAFASQSLAVAAAFPHCGRCAPHKCSRRRHRAWAPLGHERR